MSMIRLMSSRADDTGDTGVAPFTMQSWKCRNSRRKGLSQLIAGSRLTVVPSASISCTVSVDTTLEKPVP